MIGTLGFLGRAWWQQIRLLTTSRLYVLTAVLQPMIFATIAFMMFRHRADPEPLLGLALGAGLMGMWSATLLGSGAAITRHRWMGTLEGLVASPRPLVVTLLPTTLAAASMGGYSVVATLAVTWLFFDVPMSFHSPALLIVSLVATIVSLGMLGQVLSAAFVLYRAAQALSNLFEFPVYILSGMLVPTSLLPEPFLWLSYLIAPAWGVQASRASALGDGNALPPLLATVALAVVYFAVATALLRHVERRGRVAGTLALG